MSRPPEKDEPRALASARGEKASHEKPEPQSIPGAEFIQAENGRLYRRGALKFAREATHSVFHRQFILPVNYRERPREEVLGEKSKRDVAVELEAMAAEQQARLARRRAESSELLPLLAASLALRSEAQQSFAGTVAVSR